MSSAGIGEDRTADADTDTPEPLDAGKVVVLARERPSSVMASYRPYDTSVAGVVSTMPGVILGHGGAGKHRGTRSRASGPIDTGIEIGDLLVTGTIPGTASVLTAGTRR